MLLRGTATQKKKRKEKRKGKERKEKKRKEKKRKEKKRREKKRKEKKRKEKKRKEKKRKEKKNSMFCALSQNHPQCLKSSKQPETNCLSEKLRMAMANNQRRIHSSQLTIRRAILGQAVVEL